MIERWNARVSSSDTVVHLGDFALASRERTAELLGVLNGYKVLLLGNHDRSRTAMLDCGFDEVYKGEYVLDGIRCVHDPADAYPNEITLAGRVHGAWREQYDPDGARIVNVGVGCARAYTGDARRAAPGPLGTSRRRITRSTAGSCTDRAISQALSGSDVVFAWETFFLPVYSFM